jgi:hypothetical protein
MARDYFSDCQKDIDAEMHEIGNYLRFISVSFKVYAKSGAILAWVNSDNELRPLVQSFKNERIQDLTVLYQSLFVQIWGRVEYFMRKLLTAYLEHFSEQRKDFESLEKYGLARKNLKHTGIALQQIFENRSDLSIDFYLLAQNASSSIPGSRHVSLNTGTFSIFMSGPTPEGLRDAFGRVGVDLSWDMLGRVPEIQRALKTSGNRETAKEIEDYLKKAARQRNNIVHRSVQLEPIGESDVQQALDVFSALAKGLIDLAKADCKKKCA